MTVRTSNPIDAPRPLPPGLIVATARPTPPPGWLPCNGGTRAKADFPELADALGPAFSISGSTFALPNLNASNRALRGAPSGSDPGSVGGAEGHSHTYTNTASATAANFTNTNDGEHWHNQPPLTISSNGDHTHNTGGASTSGGSAGNLANARAGNLGRAAAGHTHTNNNVAFGIGNTGANHYHSTSIGGMQSSGKHVHAPTVTNNSSNSGTADNRPPFHRVYYMVKT